MDPEFPERISPATRILNFQNFLKNKEPETSLIQSASWKRDQVDLFIYSFIYAMFRKVSIVDNISLSLVQLRGPSRNYAVRLCFENEIT